MTDQIKILENTLSDRDKERLKSIFAPTVVCVPPEDARRHLIVMPDGELRYYGVIGRKTPYDDVAVLTKIYYSSRNCGLDWTFCNTGTSKTFGASVMIPWSGKWITVPDGTDESSTVAYLSDIGPDDTEPYTVKIDNRRIVNAFQPLFFEEKKRIICCGHNHYNPIVMYSDDDGESWKTVDVKSTPKERAIFPHLGVRWHQTGTETTFERLPDGRLMLIIRTSTDFFWVSYSSDLGESWTEPVPTEFHGTDTTPFILKLRDGRYVFFWNNTRPFAELNHNFQTPPICDGTKNGEWEDYFNNRDANHVAISDDCKSWTGFRELGLNDIRNASDFRLNGGIAESGDKSIHQFQAMELPFGKILVAYGQSPVSRRLVIFDVNWIFEKERHEDWQFGLKNVSTQLFVKSIYESHLRASGFGGHCSSNRTNGALLIPDPDMTCGEVLRICRIDDPCLVSPLQGVVWNFPMSHKGKLTFPLRVVGAGVRIRLCDHWINPSDRHAGRYSIFDFEICNESVTTDVWHEISVEFNIDEGMGTVFCDGKELFGIELTRKAPQGISYIHIQTMAEATDFSGTLLRRIDFTSLD